MSKIEEHGLAYKELTLKQMLELNHRSQLYGTAFTIKYDDGSVKIIGLNEEDNDI